MIKRFKLATLVGASCLAALLAANAHADYPTKSVTLVSPYGPGGAADLAARTLASVAPDLLGADVVVVNRTGAAGVTGSTSVAKARPDGYNLLLSRVGSQAAVPAINRKIPYTWDEFTFIGLLEQNPFALTVNAESPYRTFDDLKQAILDGKNLSYSSAGIGALQHLGVVVMLDQLGVETDSLTHVPFKGGGKAGAAVIGGHVDIFFQNLSGVIGNIEGGQLRALAVTTAERPESLPDVPTFRELGLPGMEVIIGWSGLWGPPDLPAEVVDTWTGVLGELKNNEAWLKKTKELGSVPMILSPSDTRAFVQSQYEVFKEVTERLGLTI